MPRSAPNPRTILVDHLQQAAETVAALAQRQTLTVTDSSRATTDPSTGVTTPGPVVMQLGQIPSGMPTSSPRWESPAHPLYGHQVLNRSTGNPVAHFGSQSDGSHGLWNLDDNGNVVLKVGEIKIGASTWYALAAYDASGNLRVMLGQLASGDYGLLVEDIDGNTQEILPAVDEYVDAAITVTSTSDVADGGPSVSAVVASSGKVFLEASAYIDTVSSNMTGSVSLWIDGSKIKEILTLSDTAGIAVANVATKRSITGLSAGSHTFELRYKASASSGVQFAARSLVVTPV